MAPKHQVLLHVGPRPTDTTHADLATQRDLFATVDHVIAEIAPDRLDRAALEMLRRHHGAGLRRRDVEGTWAGVGRALLKARTDLVLSVPEFADADDGQAALITEALAGLDVHVVITPDETADPDDLVALWSRHLKPGRLHLAPLADDAAVVDLAEELVGVALCIAASRPDGVIAKLRKQRLRNRATLRPAS